MLSVNNENEDNGEQVNNPILRFYRCVSQLILEMHIFFVFFFYLPKILSYKNPIPKVDNKTKLQSPILF